MNQEELTTIDEVAKLSNLANIIRQKGIYFSQLEFEFRKANKHHNQLLIVRFTGSKNMKLSENYLSKIEEQLSELQQNIILPLITNFKQNFVISLSVNAKGRFSMYDIALKMKVDCERPKPNTQPNARKVFRNAFNHFIPLALNIKSIQFKGYKNYPTTVEADIQITPEDLIETLKEPIFSPRAVEQWYHTGSYVLYDALKEYNFNVVLPCFEGLLIWEQRMEVVQVTMFGSNIN